MIDIINLCLSIDSTAASAYSRFRELTRNDDLKAFWNSMWDDEKLHVSYWEYLLNLSSQGIIPQLFENPVGIKAEMEDIRAKVEKLVEEIDEGISQAHTFVIAYRLEFYMLHRAFADLFTYVQSISGEDSPVDVYDSHLDRFIEAMNRFSTTPELQLLAETIHRLWRENKELSVQSSRDFLTRLLNRRGFFQSMLPLAHLSRRRNENIGIMTIDIDYFKKINDTYGHQHGDVVLKDVANAIRSHVRRSDVAARFGGEEFIIFFSAVDEKRLGEIGEKIRQAIETAGRGKIPVTVSIGITSAVLGNDVENDMNELIRQSDHCLYEAKNTGRNRVCSRYSQR